jgi:hypothetical protein
MTFENLNQFVFSPFSEDNSSSNSPMTIFSLYFENAKNKINAFLSLHDEDRIKEIVSEWKDNLDIVGFGDNSIFFSDKEGMEFFIENGFYH